MSSLYLLCVSNYDKLDDIVESNITGSLRRAVMSNTLKVLGVGLSDVFFFVLPFYENGR